MTDSRWTMMRKIKWELWQTLVLAPVSWSVLNWRARFAAHALVSDGLVARDGDWLRAIKIDEVDG